MFIIKYIAKNRKVSLENKTKDINGACEKALVLYQKLFTYLVEQDYIHDLSFIL
jgi:hypothetical protein